ncbi:MAG TPA: BadF/BadG/BcrA/BcrD ATPase family protein [Terriglobales bacterium]|nr:BadF/BadG/BcrA/BcrD ATPase family protein [Terriglobales bacterium]
MPLYLGIDGGGTKTTCAIGDDASVYAVANSSGSNIIRLGEDKARDALQSVIMEACDVAGVDPREITTACVGAAGAANPQVNAKITQIVRQLLPKADVVVVGDMVIAMEATLHSQPGVIAIAGTGSIAYGRNAQGDTARAGGWGHAISDEGSGQWIGRTAIAEVMHACDAGRETVLLERVLNTWNLGTRDDLIRHVNGTKPPSFAELFPVVQKSADDKDEVAVDVLSRAGKELAKLALIVVRRLWKPEELVRIGVAGGIFAHSSQVRRAFYNTIRRGWERTSVCFKIVDPVIGALWLARKQVPAAGAKK